MSPSLRIYAVWSREHATVDLAGRDKFVRGVKSVIATYPSCIYVMRNQLQSSRLLGMLRVLARLLKSIAGGKRSALQILLYEAPSELERLRAELKAFKPDIIFIDTARLVAVARLARSECPDARIIVDMDDLMSRRYTVLSKLAVDPNLGVIEKYVPRIFKSLIAKAGAAGLIYRSEAKGLAIAEAEISRLADAVVFASKREASDFGANTGLTGLARIEAVCPPISVLREQYPVATPPFRFIWVGTDRLTQNEQSIRYLLELWRRESFRALLIIYGKMARNWECPPNVRIAGFERDFDAIYTRESVLLVPSFVAGGIKTKVIEAFGYGIPVIGTSLAFEGLGVNYPLCFEKLDEMTEFIANIENHTLKLRQAQAIGHNFAAGNCTQARFEERWHEILTGASTPIAAMSGL